MQQGTRPITEVARIFVCDSYLKLLRLPGGCLKFCFLVVLWLACSFLRFSALLCLDVDQVVLFPLFVVVLSTTSP